MGLGWLGRAGCKPRMGRRSAQVELAAVLGVEDERLGERVVAAVTLSPGATVEPEALRAHVREHLARYKVPDQIRVVPEIPRNSMQKLMKRELAALFSDTESTAQP